MDKTDTPPDVGSNAGLGLVDRLRNTPNWMRESYGSWKDCVLKYDRAPFEAADELEVLRLQRDDLRAALGADGKWQFTHKDGRPY